MFCLRSTYFVRSMYICICASEKKFYLISYENNVKKSFRERYFNFSLCFCLHIQYFWILFLILLLMYDLKCIFLL